MEKNNAALELIRDFPDQALALSKFLVLASSSEPSEKVQFIYLVTQARDNNAAIIDAAVRISLQNNRTKDKVKIGVCGLHHPACDDYEIMRTKLMLKGVRSSEIVRIGSSHPNVGEGKKFRWFNTKVEMEVVVLHCLKMGISRVGVCSSVMHQPRAYLAAISALSKYKAGKFMSVFSLPGEPLDWNRFAVHSQGITRGKRAELLEGEILRIFEYWREGDMVAPSYGLKYLLDHCR